MIIVDWRLKRTNVEDLVRKSVENAELVESYVSSSGLLITDIVKRYIELWPETYFDIADDRKTAGMVLAYMMETAEIGVDEASEYGYLLLKLVAETEMVEFSNQAPYTYARLQQRFKPAPHEPCPDELL